MTIAAGQKGLMLPPGLGFCGVNAKALAVADANRAPRNYWGWRERLDPNEFYKAFCGTAPEHLMIGLREALDMINEEGEDAIFARHYRLSRAIHAAIDCCAEGGALENNAVVPEQRSNSVATIRVDEKYDPMDIRTICRERFNTGLGNGMGKIIKSSFRIGHMGDLNEPMIFGTIGAVEASLKLCGIPYGAGGVNAAIASLTTDD